MKRSTITLLSVLFPAVAWGQGAVMQSGPVVPTNFASWAANGIIKDSGVNSIVLTFPTVANGHLIGNATGSSHAAQDTSLTAMVDTLCASVAQGNILYRDSSVWKCLGPGTSGYFLETLGGGANPAWAAAPNNTYTAGAGLTLSGFQFSLTAPVAVANGGTGLTVGVSGGVPYYNGTTSLASSALLAQHAVMIGGGAGNAPYTLGSNGTSGYVLTSNGPSADPSWTAAAAGTVTNVALTMPNVFTVGGSPINSSGTFVVTGNGTSGGVVCFTSSSAMASSSALTLNLPVIGGGAGACPTVGTVTGNTTKFATGSGSYISGNLLKADASGNVVDAGQSLPLTGTSASIGGGSVSGGACTSGTATVTGATTSMAIAATPVTYPGDGFTWHAYVSGSNTVTTKVCNFTSGALTPSASAYNIRVLQ